MARLKPTSDTVPIDLLDFLLGYGRPAADIDALTAAGRPYDAFYEFDADAMPAADFRALWRRHEVAIRAHAAALGRTVPNPDAYRPNAAWVTSK